MSTPRYIHWSGKSGKKYSYYIYPIDTPQQEKSGNYIYAYESSPQKWTPLYIGHSSNLNTPNPEKEEDAIHFGATHIHTHLNPDENLQREEEMDLVFLYKPTCNNLGLYGNQ